jgi:hypothetical protein
MTELANRIPYENWINSQLSIARHFGGITFNGKRYVLDFENARHENGKYFPDLVLESELKKKKKKVKQEQGELL